MKTVADIVNVFGGWQHLTAQAIRLDNPGFLPLVIEAVGRAPAGCPWSQWPTTTNKTGT